MKSKSLILIALVLVFSVFADENPQTAVKDDEPLHTNTYFGGNGGGGGSGSGSGGYGGGGGAGGYSARFSHGGGVYGGGQKCKWGCCSESFGYSHTGGGYYSCSCCATAAEAKAYQEKQPKSAELMNN